MRLLSSMLARLRPFRRPRVATLGGLARHVADHAAFVSQKATWNYVRARAGATWETLFALPEFRDALEYCRWEAYAAVLTDLAEVTQVLLRRAGAPEPPLPELFARIVEVGLLRHPLPPYRSDWNDITADLRARFERANMAPPKPVRLLGRHSAARVFEVLPIPDDLKQTDRDFIENNIRFLLVRYYEDSEKLIDLDAVVAAIREGAGIEDETAGGEPNADANA